MSLFLSLSVISLRRYCQKNLAKSRGLRKKLKMGYGYIGGPMPSAHHKIITEKLEIF